MALIEKTLLNVRCPVAARAAAATGQRHTTDQLQSVSASRTPDPAA
ncbi:hypothetical protein [Streptomyces sp. TRM68367]|nr:hypothetical protein [Streptomyces sp. TRM68367]MBC9730835.1 hypothetical protein [Streptomyces sp. TRM68367]